MRVRELTQRRAVICSPDATLSTVSQMMRAHNVGSVLIAGELGLVGIATDRDIVVRGLAQGLGADARVASVMTRDVGYVYEDADIFSAVSQMESRGCRRLPVLDPDNGIRGVIALDDLVVLMSEQLAKLGGAVRKEIEPLATAS